MKPSVTVTVESALSAKMPPPRLEAVLCEIVAPAVIASFAPETSATPPPFTAEFPFPALPPTVAPFRVTAAVAPVA